jgi:hypothetical protein
VASDENGIWSRLSKLEALFARAGTPGERSAAGAAIERLQQKLGTKEPPTELAFSLPDVWSVKLFLALCRKYDLKPYRYPRQRRTTVMVTAPREFLEKVVWAEFSELQKELAQYFEETTEHLISTAMGSNGDDSNIETKRIAT